MPQHHGSAVIETVRALAEQIRNLESNRQRQPDSFVSSGSTVLDGLLPEGGFRRGTLVEWLFPGAGGGVGTLALLAAREACHDEGALVVVDRHRTFYPPAAAYWGIDLERLIIVRPQNDLDDAWAWDQSLRSAAVSAVWGWPHPEDEQTLRRWQLAAEASGAIGFLLRPEQVREEPSWAELRLLVEPVPTSHRPGDVWRRVMRVELLRARGAIAGGAVKCELDEENGCFLESRSDNEEFATNRVHLAAELAPSASHPLWGSA